jgi:formamidopyrimidine-DNA glycosylase
MSGRLVFRAPSQRHDHFAFRFVRDSWLTFNDIRRFGRVYRVPETQIWSEPPLSSLGPDALSSAVGEKTFRISSGRSIKSMLLDQRVVAGLGNIYSCEILYHAGILPTRATASLSLSERKSLVRAIKSTLRAAIVRGGSTLDDYRGTEGQSGDYDRFFAVFANEGGPCPRCTCKTGIKRIIHHGRSTYYCQKLQA